MAGNRWARLDPKVVFFVCDAFMHGLGADEIAAEVRTRFNEPLARTQVYQVIAEARGRGYLKLTPPRDALLSDRMMERFVRSRTRKVPGMEARPGDRKLIRVVSQGYEVALEHVAVAAAETALKVITDIFKKTNPAAPAKARKSKRAEPVAVHVGFGAGATTMLVARYLAELLRSEVEPPCVVLHALSSGFHVAEPATAPVAFFNFFHGIPGISYRGLFAPAYVRSTDWQGMRDSVGVRESFAAKERLQVVITALASRLDRHGELNRFMEVNAKLGEEARRVLDVEEGRIGDVMYRPFNARGPITRSTGIRAVTLFELEELVEFAAQEDKAVLLVAGPCGNADCGRSRSDALMPLLEEPSLQVWSHLVTDDVTAVNCLEGRMPA